MSCDTVGRGECRSAVIPSTPFEMRNSSSPGGPRRQTRHLFSADERLGVRGHRVQPPKNPPLSPTAPPDCGLHHRDTLLMGRCLVFYHFTSRLSSSEDVLPCLLSRCICDPYHPNPQSPPHSATLLGVWPQDENLEAQKDRLPRADKDTLLLSQIRNTKN